MTLSDIVTTLLLGYPLPPEMIDSRYPVFLQRSAGLGLTLLITVLSMGCGCVIGIGLTLCRREATTEWRPHKRLARLVATVLRFASIAVTEVIRGLPIMLLVLLTFDLPYRLFQIRVPGPILAVVAFSTYAGAYLSEILRAGLRSVTPELRYAGKVLGLTRWKILLRIELPIVCRNMMPDLVNLTITIFKDTSTLAVVAVAELTYTARQMLMSEPLNYGLIWIIVLVSYWSVATLLSMYSIYAERRRVDERGSRN
jgi:polar amino acid transport system permease protein